MVTQEEASAVDRAVQAVMVAALTLGTSPRSASQRALDPLSALEAADRVEHELVAAPDTAKARQSLLDVRAARTELLTFQLARQRSMLPVLNRSLSRLRAASTIDDLVDSIPIHAVELGYDRALFSWVQDERWVPRSAYTASDPQEAQALLAAAGPPYVHTRELFEVDVVRRRSPILVLDATENPRVHPGLWQVTHSHSYVAAPIVARGHVAAFVHLDRNLDTGTTDEFDRDLLAAMCQGVGLMLDRLLEGSVPGGQTPPSLTQRWAQVLTPREREVLRLVAAGHTNAQIGARLFISEETTKTHLKKLMRKLGVSNRSQAGAMYHQLRAEPGTRPGADRASSTD